MKDCKEVIKEKIEDVKAESYLSDYLKGLLEIIELQQAQIKRLDRIIKNHIEHNDELVY